MFACSVGARIARQKVASSIAAPTPHHCHKLFSKIEPIV